MTDEEMAAYQRKLFDEFPGNMREAMLVFQSSAVTAMKAFGGPAFPAEYLHALTQTYPRSSPSARAAHAAKSRKLTLVSEDTHNGG